MSLFGPSPEKIEKWTEQKNASKLLSCLSSDDATMRRLAAEGLGKVGGPEVLEYCKSNARNSDHNVRWHISQILGLMGTPEAMKIMQDVMDPTEAIKRGAKRKKEQSQEGEKS